MTALQLIITITGAATVAAKLTDFIVWLDTPRRKSHSKK